MDFFVPASAMSEQLAAHRRYLHRNAESGLVLPVTCAYIGEQLRKMGVEKVMPCGPGLVAVIEGERPGRTVLLRSDLDGVPMAERNDLEYRSRTGNAHTCGHDLHAAMGLGAAKLLLDRRQELKGRVKLMFQPGEETFEGARGMIEGGALQNPQVDAAIGLHVDLDHSPGVVSCGVDYTASSMDMFTVTIAGKGCQGLTPELGVDPIGVGVILYQAFSQLAAREVPSEATVTLTFGQFSAGATWDIIPETATLRGTLRTDHPEHRSHLLERMRQVADHLAKAAGASADMQVNLGVPPMYNDPRLRQLVLEELSGGGYLSVQTESPGLRPSDDFAYISSRIPSVYLLLGAGVRGNRGSYHNPEVQFNEDALPLGAAALAQCAAGYLESQAG